jgi:hypothetical protein
MAFIKSNGTVLSFATPADVTARDTRLFEANEGLTEDVILAHLQRATARILSKLRNSDWWKNYYLKNTTTSTALVDVPPLDANRIIDRLDEFNSLCIFVGMSEFILPQVADFGKEDNSEFRKMAHYTTQAEKMFGEIVAAGDWYDFDGTGVVTTKEKDPGLYNLKRVR